MNQDVQAHVTVTLEGLPGVGTVAQAQHSALITLPDSPLPGNRLTADAHARLKQMEEDAELLEQMAVTQTEQPVRYTARPMLTRSLAVCLDSDMRILPAKSVTPIVTSFIARLLQAAKTILGLPPSQTP